MEDNKFDIPDEPAGSGPLPTGLVAFIIIAFFAVALGLIMHSKSKQRIHDEQVMTLEHELDSDKAALDAQKQKVVQMTQQLEDLKQKLQMGLVSGKEKIQLTAQYHTLVQEQHTERDKFVPLADAYNAKVEKLNDLK
jgi:hypothetical protein